MESHLLALQKTACPPGLRSLNRGRMRFPFPFLNSLKGIIIPFAKSARFLLLFGLTTCFSIEFIPEAPSQEETLISHKKNWEQIEILKNSPKKKNYRVFGKLIIRNFGEGKIEKYYYDKIKKELFDKGMDGMYVINSGMVPIPPTIFQAGSAEGYSYNMAEIAKDARVIEAMAFRYRDRHEE